jgi:putative GTP pyrophosphokinase
MAYTPIPTESKTQINNAGIFLAQSSWPGGTGTLLEYLSARDMANRWRACHAYPINTFQATLRTNLKGYKGNPIVAQRLKRMPTVIDKLIRHPHMKLTTMQDIGGIRAILEDIDDVHKIVDKYITNKKFPHALVQKYDYITNPRDADGYRSIHLVYKYLNKGNPLFDGLRVEMQIRTKLQHIWATAVETMGTFIGQALKSRQGDEDWLNFFALVSSAFAHIEGTAPIPRFNHLTEDQTYIEVARMEDQLGVLDKIKGFSYVVKSLGDDKTYAFHLIVIDNNIGEVSVFPYGGDSYSKAVEDYNDYEAKKEENIDVVLVSAGPIEILKKAYPNLFLDLSEFESSLRYVVSQGIIAEYSNKS